jgi:hypothetical protein
MHADSGGLGSIADEQLVGAVFSAGPAAIAPGRRRRFAPPCAGHENSPIDARSSAADGQSNGSPRFVATPMRRIEWDVRRLRHPNRHGVSGFGAELAGEVLAEPRLSADGDGSTWCRRKKRSSTPNTVTDPAA